MRPLTVMNSGTAGTSPLSSIQRTSHMHKDCPQCEFKRCGDRCNEALREDRFEHRQHRKALVDVRRGRSSARRHDFDAETRSGRPMTDGAARGQVVLTA